MLKNIVFDLGNVLVKFDSNELIYSFFNEGQEEVKSFYFDSLWDEYDQGLYSVEEMIEKGVKQFPELELNIKELMYQLDQRICNLEVKLQDLEGSQGILEESLAYINRYLVEKN